MVEKMDLTEEMDVVVQEVMVEEVMEMAGVGVMHISKRSKLLHLSIIICGITTQPHQQVLIMAQ